MIFRVQFRDPDTLTDSIREAVELELSRGGLDKDEQDMLVDQRCNKVSEQVHKWFRYGEYVVIELDTDKGTATVVAE